MRWGRARTRLLDRSDLEQAPRSRLLSDGPTGEGSKKTLVEHNATRDLLRSKSRSADFVQIETGGNAFAVVWSPRQAPVDIFKAGRILDGPDGAFRLEYDDTLGHKRNTRLDAMRCEQAVREARSYLEIGEDDRDPEGAQWDIE